MMWSTFHIVWTSREFVNLWEEHLQMSTSTPPNPLLYQHLTTLLFGQQLRRKLATCPATCTPQEPLTAEELKGLKCMVGFVPHSLLKKLHKSSHPGRKELCKRNVRLSRRWSTHHATVDVDNKQRSFGSLHLWSLKFLLPKELLEWIRGVTIRDFILGVNHGCVISQTLIPSDSTALAINAFNLWIYLRNSVWFCCMRSTSWDAVRYLQLAWLEGMVLDFSVMLRVFLTLHTQSTWN